MPLCPASMGIYTRDLRPGLVFLAFFRLSSHRFVG